ncbi:hypothetical protein OBA38_00660, partial [bacterium]|nr:hypothetical protein [bacterium]
MKLKSLVKKFIVKVYTLLISIDSLLLNINKSVIVLDIDNTIAKTWPTLVNRKSFSENDEKNRLLSLERIEYSNSLIDYSIKNFDCILFLSARNPIHYKITKTWLKKNFGDFEF